MPGAPGGGFRLNGVLDASGQYKPFKVAGPIGFLGRNQTPTGAFSRATRAGRETRWAAASPRHAAS